MTYKLWVSTLILAQCFALGGFADDSKVEEKSFDVRELIMVLPDFIPPEFIWEGSELYLDQVIEEEPVLDEPYDPDALVELIESFVEPGSWDAPHTVEFRQGSIVVRHKKEVIEQVAALLQKYAKRRFVPFKIQVKAYSISKTKLKQWNEKGVFDAQQTIEEMAGLTKGLIPFHENLTQGPNSARFFARSGRVVPYPASVKPLAGAKDVLVPVWHKAYEGSQLDVRPVLRLGGDQIMLNLRFHHTMDLSFVEAKVKGGQVVKRPEVIHHMVRGEHNMNLDRLLVLQGPDRKQGKEQVVYVFGVEKILEDKFYQPYHPLFMKNMMLYLKVLQKNVTDEEAKEALAELNSEDPEERLLAFQFIKENLLLILPQVLEALKEPKQWSPEKLHLLKQLEVLGLDSALFDYVRVFKKKKMTFDVAYLLRLAEHVSEADQKIVFKQLERVSGERPKTDLSAWKDWHKTRKK